MYTTNQEYEIFFKKHAWFTFLNTVNKGLCLYTYVTVDHFHLPGMAHGWSLRFWGEMSSLLSSKVCVQVLKRHRQTQH